MTNEQYKSWRFPEWLAAAVMLGFRVGMQRAEMLTGSAAVNEAIVDSEVPALEALAVSVNLGEDSVPVQI
uniref:Uncharacterized protein n=1 Tax=Oryza nivara TaxID=4536 RepID=A0A0E0J3S8_ORYNI